jgi:DNA polymerase-3 subunit epsilon
VNDYLLFLDTETSGLPKNWNLPYAASGNWPFSVQVAWIIYTKDGHELKRENHYIKDEAVTIDKSATKIHGITSDFLSKNGEERKDVLQLLHRDLVHFQPLVIGHFIEFDQHILAADFLRTNIENLLKKENSFCTMLATTHLVKNPALKFFRLGQLYETLFNKTLEDQHNALNDAKASADCFFELLKRGEIDDGKIVFQQQQTKNTDHTGGKHGCATLVLAIISFLILITFFL